MTKCQWRQIRLQNQPRVSVFQCLPIWVKFKYERRQKAGVGVVKLCIFPMTLRQNKLECFSLTIFNDIVIFAMGRLFCPYRKILDQPEKNLSGTNTLAYSSPSSVTTDERLIQVAPGPYVKEHFTAVIKTVPLQVRVFIQSVTFTLV